MGRKNSNMPLVLMMIITMVIFFVLYGGANLAIADEYIDLLPSVFILVISIYGIRTSRGVTVMGAFIMLGVGFALLTDELNTLNIIVPDMLTPAFTLQYLQALIIAFSTIIGAAMTRN